MSKPRSVIIALLSTLIFCSAIKSQRYPLDNSGNLQLYVRSFSDPTIQFLYENLNKDCLVSMSNKYVYIKGLCNNCIVNLESEKNFCPQTSCPSENLDIQNHLIALLTYQNLRNLRTQPFKTFINIQNGNEYVTLGRYTQEPKKIVEVQQEEPVVTQEEPVEQTEQVAEQQEPVPQEKEATQKIDPQPVVAKESKQEVAARPVYKDDRTWSRRRRWRKRRSFDLPALNTHQSDFLSDHLNIGNSLKSTMASDLSGPGEFFHKKKWKKQAQTAGKLGYEGFHDDYELDHKASYMQNDRNEGLYDGITFFRKRRRRRF